MILMYINGTLRSAVVKYRNSYKVVHNFTRVKYTRITFHTVVKYLSKFTFREVSDEEYLLMIIGGIKND